MNSIHITGRLCADPELRQTTSGIAVCRFRVAVNRKFSNKQTGEREADFITCAAWRNTAEFVSRYFRKGGWIEVSGELRNNDYEDNNGVKHYSMNVLADYVGFVGNKDGSQAAQNAPYQPQGMQTQNYTPQPQTRSQPPQSAPVAHTYQQDVQQAQQIGNLGDFEEILSDGDVPF
jgi:single-strand DNA-binding protein